MQPYAELKLKPFFGIARDKDGNIIRKFEGDGTFWTDNPRFGINGDTRELIWEDEDGDEILKKFKDGSFLAVERMYRDWIHDSSEKDHEYIFEKNEAGGNMVIVRQKSKSDGRSDDLINSPDHDHDTDDRPLFVKLTLAYAKRNNIKSLPVGSHVMATYDDKGKATYSRLDAAGDSILQANGYQFRGSTEMAKWMDTYLRNIKRKMAHG